MPTLLGMVRPKAVLPHLWLRSCPVAINWIGLIRGIEVSIACAIQRENLATLIHPDQVALSGLHLRDLRRDLHYGAVSLAAIDTNLSYD